MIYEIIDVPQTTKVMFRTSVDPGSYIPSHLHRAIEIIYLLEGTLDVTVENQTTHYSQGDCILINANIVHSTRCTSLNKAILLQIPIEFARLYLPNIQQLLFVLDKNPTDPIRQTKLEIFKNTLIQMQITNDIKPEGFLLRFNSLLFELLFQLLHNFSIKVFHSDSKQRTKDLERLNTILDYITQNYKHSISLDEIADIACLQTGYFCRFFKKNMGVTFLEYQNELRLSHIYQDIISTNDTIHDILERHGFVNYKLFRRMFFQHFNATPTQVRKDYRNH
ncbi:MAG: AraC family transcriptional regulator [Lachnospiraceae bacterium]|nr:AraC family transcriptional regulator [Lachnospiraceae bacterium]